MLDHSKISKPKTPPHLKKTTNLSTRLRRTNTKKATNQHDPRLCAQVSATSRPEPRRRPRRRPRRPAVSLSLVLAHALFLYTCLYRLSLSLSLIAWLLLGGLIVGGGMECGGVLSRLGGRCL